MRLSDKRIGSLQVRSVAEILARAEDVQRRCHDLVAQAPGGGGGDDQTLPGDGGGGAAAISAFALAGRMHNIIHQTWSIDYQPKRSR
jgi:hypothetical protein